MRSWNRWAAAGLLLVAGCAEEPKSEAVGEAAPPARLAAPFDSSRSMPAAAPTLAAKSVGGQANVMMGMMPGAAPADGGEPAPATPPPTEPPKAVARKIIYNADVDLVVDDFDRLEQGLRRLVKESGGYLADADVSGTKGVQRSGRWKVRVPVERFDAFVESAVRLGELQRRQTNSQDVTEEFYDLEARIKNKKVEEGRLVKHLEESTGKLKEILDVEREISRVREEVERLQGRLQMLANLTALTTVTITAREVRDYTPAAAPTFGTRVARAFQGSAESLVLFLGEVVLAVVRFVPWLPIWGVALALCWLVVRRLRVRLRARPAAAPLPPA
jgi:hypothetical protein